jgi:hypothetical protein
MTDVTSLYFRTRGTAIIYDCRAVQTTWMFRRIVLRFSFTCCIAPPILPPTGPEKLESGLESRYNVANKECHKIDDIVASTLGK